MYATLNLHTSMFIVHQPWPSLSNYKHMFDQQGSEKVLVTPIFSMLSTAHVVDVLVKLWQKSCNKPSSCTPLECSMRISGNVVLMQP